MACVPIIPALTTDANAFRLANRVTAGAFEYQLFRGSAAQGNIGIRVIW